MSSGSSTGTFSVLIILGLLLGVVAGLLFDNIGLGAGLGLLAGVVLGAIFSGSRRRPGPRSDGSPRP